MTEVTDSFGDVHIVVGVEQATLVAGTLAADDDSLLDLPGGMSVVASAGRRPAGQALAVEERAEARLHFLRCLGGSGGGEGEHEYEEG